MSTSIINLPAAVHLQGPLVGASGDHHELVISGANGVTAHVRGTLAELALHAAGVAGPIVEARAAERADSETPPDSPAVAVAVDREQLTTWATDWVDGEYGDGFAAFGILAASDVVALVMALNDSYPDDSGWSTHPKVKAVVASATDDDAVIVALDVAAGFRLCTLTQETPDLNDEAGRGGELAAHIAVHLANLLNEAWAAYRATC